MILLRLFIEFFKIGLFSFGGGNAMLPLIYQSILQFSQLDSSAFSDMVALSQVTPGPVAVNAATYIGLLAAGIPGAISATIGVSLPCFIIMLIVIRLLDKYRNSTVVEGAFAGIRPVTIGLLLAAAMFLMNDVLVKGPLVSAELMNPSYFNLIPMGIFAVSILLISLVKMKPLHVMLLMGAAGAVIYGVI
ncbi:MAG: chromate transporter [Clostridiales bacterium]|nr:chromate transporter [Clostridiales bacterium]